MDQSQSTQTVNSISVSSSRRKQWAKFAFFALLSIVSVVALITEPRFEKRQYWQYVGGAFGFPAAALHEWLSLHNRDIRKESKAIQIVHDVLAGITTVIIAGFMIYYAVCTFHWLRTVAA